LAATLSLLLMNPALHLGPVFTNRLILLSGSPFPSIKMCEIAEHEVLLNLCYFSKILVKSRMQELKELMHYLD